MNQHYDLIIIGSGPSGKTAAIQAAKLGKNVALIESMPKVGGVCVHTGTIPSKTLRETVLHLTGWRERGFYGQSYRTKAEITAIDLLNRLRQTLKSEMDILEDQLVRNGVHIIAGFGSLISKTQVAVSCLNGEKITIVSEKIILAVGTKTYRPDNVPFDGSRIIDSDEIINLTKMPRTLTVVGAGVIGVEYATIFQTLDVNVTLIEPRDTMLDFLDKELLMNFQHEINNEGMRLEFGQKIVKIEARDDGPCVVHLSSKRAIASDMILFAAGRIGATEKIGLKKVNIPVDHRGRISVNSQFQTSVPSIYAVGDVIGFPSLASTSLEQGRIAALNALGFESRSNPKYFPYGIYSVPEMSSVGMTEQETQKRKFGYEIGIVPLRETSKGKIIGLQSGMMKLIFSTKSRRLLGVHIVGEGATELIHIGQAVLTLKGTIDYFLDNAFNYPTLAEAYKVAALNAHNRMALLSKEGQHENN